MPVQKLSGTTLHYQELGKGMPLVLLHGYPLDSRVFCNQIADLSRSYRVILPDMSGFGRSSSTKPFTIRSLADEIFELLTHINALPCVLGGLSMGGYVTLAYQESYPNTLRGMILIDTRAEPENPEGKMARDTAIEMAQRGSSQIVEQMLPKLFAQGSQPNAEVLADLKAIMENCPAITMQNALRAMRDRDDFRPGLSKVVAPTLILVGDSDTITPLMYAQTMHERIKGSKLTVIPNAGHISVMERPREVNHAIEIFLREINRPL